jgi:phage I-like protein
MDKAILNEVALNAEGEVPEWVHLIPAGKAVQAVDGRNWVMPDMAAVVAQSMTGVDLPIDYEHQTEDPSQRVGNGPVPAAGWITQLEARENGIWGRVTWTATAKGLLSAREYRYLSPTFSFNKATRAIGRITGAGLVHTPALRLTALAREEGGADQPTQQNDSVSDTANAILAALGLPENSPKETALATIAALKDAKANLQEKPTVGMDVLQGALQDRREALAKLTEQAIEQRVSDAMFNGHITPAMKDWATDLCRNDPSSFDNFCQAFPPMMAGLFKSQFDEKFAAGLLRDIRGGVASEPNKAEIAATLGVAPDRLK